MKTSFQSGNYLFDPQNVTYYTGPDGRARMMRAWLVYINGVYLGTRYYPPRATKQEITA